MINNIAQILNGLTVVILAYIVGVLIVVVSYRVYAFLTNFWIAIRISYDFMEGCRDLKFWVQLPIKCFLLTIGYYYDDKIIYLKKEKKNA